MKTSLSVLALALPLLSACTSTTPNLDKQFGQSTRALTAQQIINPNAAIDNAANTVSGIDGRAARDTVDRYQRGFAEPVRTGGSFTIGIGTGTAADTPVAPTAR